MHYKSLVGLTNFPSDYFLKIHPGILEQAKALLLVGKYQACIYFLSSLPIKLVNSSPSLLLYQATAMLFNEYPQGDIETILCKAEQLIGSEKIAGEITAIRATISSYTQNPEAGIRLSQIALKKIDPRNTYFRNIIERNLGIAYTIKNDLQRANLWFEKLLMSSCELEDWGGVLAAYNYLTYIRKVQGRLREAEVIFQKALEFIRIYNLEKMPHAIKIISGFGHLLLYRHHIDEAKTYFIKAIQLAKQTDTLYAYTAYQNLSEAYIRENNTTAALQVLSELQKIVQGKKELYEKIHLQHTLALKARIFVVSGEIEPAFDWLISSGFEQLQPHKLYQHYGYELGMILPIAAQIFSLKGMHDRAIQVLKVAIPKFIHQGAHSYLIRALSALAIVYHQSEQHQIAISTLSKAIALGQPETNVGDFLFFGQALIPVLTEILQATSANSFTGKLMCIFENSSSPNNCSSKEAQPQTILSGRERDVLELIADGMTNRQIALELYLSTNTVKTHSINIYRKLNVTNRNQATSKAISLGILPIHKSRTISEFKHITA